MDLSGSYNWRTDPKVAPGGYFDDLAGTVLIYLSTYWERLKRFQASVLTSKAYMLQRMPFRLLLHQGGGREWGMELWNRADG